MKLFSLFRRFVDSKENIFTKETAKLRFFLIPTQQADRLRGVSLNWEQQPTFHLVISVFFWVFTLGMIYFFSFPRSTIWTERSCQTIMWRFLQASLFWDQNAGQTWHQSHEYRAERELVNMLCCEVVMHRITTVRQKEVFHYFAVRHVGLLILEVPAGKMVNKLLSRPLQSLKGVSRVPLSMKKKNPYALLWNQTSWVPCVHVSPSMSISRRCGKGLETQNDWLVQCSAWLPRWPAPLRSLASISPLQQPLHSPWYFTITGSAVQYCHNEGLINTAISPRYYAYLWIKKCIFYIDLYPFLTANLFDGKIMWTKWHFLLTCLVINVNSIPGESQTMLILNGWQCISFVFYRNSTVMW